MTAARTDRARVLADRWGLNVRHALYRKTGNWYHQLTEFPGALLDADGYVIFETEEAFRSCRSLQIVKQVSAPKTIKAIPGYVYVWGTADRPERSAVESLVRPRPASAGQAWATTPETRRAIERYAMDLAIQHYAPAWPDISDVSATQPFDLLCRNGQRELRVEVKGTTSRGESVLLTRNEVQHARANAGLVALFVVSEIGITSAQVCIGGVTQVFEPWDIQGSELEPVAFECWPEARHNKRLQPMARRTSRGSRTQSRRG